jgi:DNA repair exonuclease SbcCD ATPase subunit
MSKIIFLKQLILKNFKGIKDLTIDFSKVTSIFGDNGTGKTTVNDAFTWLLFDKDSHDVSKFNVQPLDEHGNTVHMLETEVNATLVIDGLNTVLKKVLKEKWVKPKGQPEAELKGTTTDYYMNEVPQKQGEYKKIVDNIIPEDIFKLLTNPLYFSSVMSWKDRRKIIFDINGDVSQSEVISSNKKLAELTKLLNPNESMDDFNKRIKAQISKLKIDQANIPARVDECNRSIKTVDFDVLEIKRKGVISDLNSIDEKLIDTSKANDELLEKKDNLYKLKDEMKNIEWKARIEAQKPLEELNKKLQDAQIKLNSSRSKLQLIKNNIEGANLVIENKKVEREQLLKKWYEENSKELIFDENEFICPTCHRPFEEGDIEAKKAEMEGNFNQNKASKLKDITAKGQSLNKEIEDLKIKISDYDTENLEKTIKEFELEVETIKVKIQEFKPDIDLSSSSEYQQLLKQVESLENELQQPKDNGIYDLKIKKREMENELENINTELAAKNHNVELEQRITDLQAKGKEIAQQIANLEKAQYLSDEFTRTKVELLEGSINSKFKLVKIKLFENQVNGGLNECCEVMVNGVPFSTNLNSGAKINAGLDIINTLSNYYEVNAPIFVDNKESITKVINTDSQVINLIVSEPDKILKIESEEI